jgi:hypothetical protein
MLFGRGTRGRGEGCYSEGGRGGAVRYASRKGGEGARSDGRKGWGMGGGEEGP